MNKINRFTIIRDNFDSQEEFENAIKAAVMVLLENNYIMTVRYEEKGLGIVAIDYNYSEQELGDAYPYWLLPEEWERVVDENEIDY